MIEWQIYWMIEPPLETRVDIGFAQLMSLLANVNRDSKRQPEPWTPADFLPSWAREQKSDGADGDAKGGMDDPEHVRGVMQRLMARQKLVEEQRKGLAGADS